MTALRNHLRRFSSDLRGAVLTEALLVFPFIIIFSVGILEFGNVLWQRHQLQTGVRDAARYLARCSDSPTFGAPCDLQVARNIAFYGSPDGTASGTQRVPGWDHETELSVTYPVRGGIRMVVVSAAVDYIDSPLFGMLAVPGFQIEYAYMQRYIGW